MREQPCCFTGHRELPVWGREQLAEKLEATITGLIDRGIIFYEAGDARGCDTLAAGTVLKLKSSYPNIKLILVLPCLTQTRGWRSSTLPADGEKLQRPQKALEVLRQNHYNQNQQNSVSDAMRSKILYTVGSIVALLVVLTIFCSIRPEGFLRRGETTAPATTPRPPQAHCGR